MGRCRGIGAGLAAAVVAAGLMAVGPAAASPAGCHPEPVTVALTPGGPPVHRLATWLCRPAGPADTVFLTVSGSTYNHRYWDFPYQPERYSFVRAGLAAGFAVLNFDRIGVGESDHPPAETVDVDAHAFVLHQLLGRLRSGGFGRPFGHVLTVGHSQGSAIVTHEAARYHDVDGVILTGLLRTPIGPSTTRFGTALYPAGLDPAFAGRRLPPGYTTTRPGTRGDIFYVRANTDPAVIDLDEATKDVLAWAEGSSAPTARESTDIHVPVLSVLGDRDGFFCYTACTDPAVLIGAESRFWAPDTCFELFLLHDVGHNDNLHRNAGLWYRRAFDWTAERVGGAAGGPPTRRCS